MALMKKNLRIFIRLIGRKLIFVKDANDMNIVEIPDVS